MEPGRQCEARREGWPCVLDKNHVGQHVTCDGYRWEVGDWRKESKE